MIGVEAYLSDELKQHETILSYTADFYNQDEIRMVTGALVYVTDGVDTIVYHEDMENPGHYLTDSTAGKRNTLYRLHIEIPGGDSEPIIGHHLADEICTAALRCRWQYAETASCLHAGLYDGGQFYPQQVLLAECVCHGARPPFITNLAGYVC